MAEPVGRLRVGLLGGGVIGGGWAARFLLNGHDVVLFDPDPQAERKVGEVLANARRAMGKLVMPQLPAEGTLTLVVTPEEAATDVDFVQESAPERLELKQDLLRRASAVAPAHVVFGSSTSGLLPTLMQQGMTHPERFVVGHPFNPVYLMPLVEVVGGDLTSDVAKSRASQIYTSLGMHPLLLSKEIDGFVADRLMEALWREALWLINDGVATASEIDDAMRFGPGLRWSFMGTMLIYRIAGGEAGMRHFMAQFGPALQWPWTKLMDVPELTDELLNTICDQSDEQAGTQSIRELERLRDDCLVSVMQSLRSATPGGYGAGQDLDRYEQTLFAKAPTPRLDELDFSQPLPVYSRRVPTEWVDYNGHTNDSRYLQLSSEGADVFLRMIGLDDTYLASGRSIYTVESHVNYVEQSYAGDVVEVSVQLLSHSEKKLQFFTAMYRQADSGRELIATAEHFMLHVDTAASKACPMSDDMLARLDRIAAHHRNLPAPEQAGRFVGQR